MNTSFWRHDKPRNGSNIKGHLINRINHGIRQVENRGRRWYGKVDGQANKNTNKYKYKQMEIQIRLETGTWMVVCREGQAMPSAKRLSSSANAQDDFKFLNFFPGK